MKRPEPTIQSLSRKHKKKNKQLSNKRIRKSKQMDTYSLPHSFVR